MVEPSRNTGNPPLGGATVYTPVVCEYWPVRMVVRLGQHSEFVTNPLSNVTPRAARRASTWGMADRVSQRWSSVRIKTILGRAWAVRAPRASAGAVGAAT